MAKRLYGKILHSVRLSYKLYILNEIDEFSAFNEYSIPVTCAIRTEIFVKLTS